MSAPSAALAALAALESWATAIPLPPPILRRLALARSIISDALADAGFVEGEAREDAA